MLPSLHTAYGIDPAAGGVIVARGRRRKGGIELEVVTDCLTCANDAEWTTTAKRLNHEQATLSAQVVWPAFAHDSFIRSLDAPFPPGRKALAVLPSLLDVQLPFPLEQCVYRFVTLEPAADGHTLAMAVAMPEERLQQTLETARAAGIDPGVLMPEALALWNADEAVCPAKQGQVRVTLYLGADRTIVVVGLNRRPAASFSARAAWPGRTPGEGGKLLARLRPFLAGALRALPDVVPEYRVGGPGAASRDHAEALREELDLPAREWTVVDQPAHQMAFALARSGLAAGASAANLRTGRFAHPATRRYAARRARRSTGALTAGAIAAIVALTGSGIMLQRHHDTLRADIRATVMTMTGKSAVEIPRGMELLTARRDMEGRSGLYDVMAAWREPTLYPVFSGLLRAAEARGIQLESVSLRPGSVVVRGTSTGWNDAEVLAGLLRRTYPVMELERDDSTTDDRIVFVLRGQS